MAEQEATQLEGVIYTDGGCRSKDPRNPASRGYAGWGMHGYMYTTDAPKKGSGSKQGLPTKEGYKKNGKGKGDITVKKYVDGFVSLPGEGTNNQAELAAAGEAVQLALKENLSRLLIITDSKYVIQGVDWSKKWKTNGWVSSNGSPISNKEQWTVLDKNIQEYKAGGSTLEFRWVKGHNGTDADPGNVIADRYATRGVLANMADKPLRRIKVSEAEGYWKAANEHNRLLDMANWYFTTSGQMDVTTKDGRAIYYLGDIKTGEEFLGKKISDASFAVVYLKEPEAVLERLRGYFKDLSKGNMQGLVVGDLHAIFRSEMHDLLEDHGEDLLIFNKARQSVEHMDRAKDGDRQGISLGHEIRPTRLAYTAVNVMESLEGVLNDYLHPKPSTRIRSTDITSLLYEHTTVKNKTKCKLKGEVTTSTRSIQAKVNYYLDKKEQTKDVCLTLNQDLPSRNTLSALAIPDIKVTVVTWPESSNAFRYAAVVETQDDIAIYAGPYSNLQLSDLT